jgi:hypothetical protein
LHNGELLKAFEELDPAVSGFVDRDGLQQIVAQFGAKSGVVLTKQVSLQSRSPQIFEHDALIRRACIAGVGHSLPSIHTPQPSVPIPQAARGVKRRQRTLPRELCG